MPIGAWAQIQYWAKGDGLQSAPRLTKGGYPAWQSSVILGSAFGWCQVLWERCVWWAVWLRRLWRLTTKERVWLDARVDRLVQLSDTPSRERSVPREALIGARSSLAIREATVIKLGIDLDMALADTELLRTQLARVKPIVDAGFEAIAKANREALAPKERRLIVGAVEDLLDSVAYSEARIAVQETATTLGFNRPQAWVKLSHTLKDLSPWAENSWRHLNAMWLLEQRLTERRAIDDTVPVLTNPERNLLIELAYSGFAAKPKD